MSLMFWELTEMIHLHAHYETFSKATSVWVKTTKKSLSDQMKPVFSCNDISSPFHTFSLCRLDVTAPDFPTTESSPTRPLLSSALAFSLSLLLIWEADQWKIMRADFGWMWEHATQDCLPGTFPQRNHFKQRCNLWLDITEKHYYSYLVKTLNQSVTFQRVVTSYCNHTKMSNEFKDKWIWSNWIIQTLCTVSLLLARSDRTKIFLPDTSKIHSSCFCSGKRNLGIGVDDSRRWWDQRRSESIRVKMKRKLWELEASDKRSRRCPLENTVFSSFRQKKSHHTGRQNLHLTALTINVWG